MVSGFICGTSSLPRDEDDQQYERRTRSADSSPRKSRLGCSSNNSNKNPYSSRGLDKFSALLAEIEDKRQQIYTKVDPDKISLVRFTYSGDHDFKPIIVKSKPKAATDQTVKQKPNIITSSEQKPPLLSKLPSSSTMVVSKTTTNDANKVIKKGFYKDFKGYQLKDPKLYLPMIFIVILAILVVFGRSFAIMCTSIGWYVIPTIKNQANSTSLRTSFKKKDYGRRRLSEKKLLMTGEGVKSFKGVDYGKKILNV